MTPGEAITRRAIRTPRAAAVAGIVFSVLLTVALVLIRLAVPADPNDAGAWLSDDSRRNAVLFALGLIPFAGIAFLWFIGVVRGRIGDVEDRFFATVFLGSGLLFVAMLFVSSAVVGGLVEGARQGARISVAPDVWAFGRHEMYALATIYGLRMAGVFVASTSTILLRERIAPRWLAILGYLVALALLVTLGLSAWIALVFPAWVFVLSVHILIVSLRPAGEPSGRSPVEG